MVGLERLGEFCSDDAKDATPKARTKKQTFTILLWGGEMERNLSNGSSRRRLGPWIILDRPRLGKSTCRLSAFDPVG